MIAVALFVSLMLVPIQAHNAITTLIGWRCCLDGEIGLVEDKQTLTLHGHTHYVTSVAFSPDGKMLASGSRDKTIKLWDVTLGKELATLKGHEGSVSSVVFSPDGATCASASDDHTVKLWNVQKAKEQATLKGHNSFVTFVT